MVHTRHGLYSVREDLETQTNLITDKDYEVPTVGHISAVTAFDEYIFSSLGTDIYYWVEGQKKANKLEGTYNPNTW